MVEIVAEAEALVTAAAAVLVITSKGCQPLLVITYST